MSPNNSFLCWLGVVPALLLGGCAVGPHYERSGPVLGETFRFGSRAAGPSLGELDWRSVFQDPVLQGLIGEALANNPDRQIAASRVLQAQASLEVVRSQLFPNLGASLNSARRGVSASEAGGPAATSESTSAGLNLLTYEFDFWGKFRRASEAARARLLATAEGQRLVESGLVCSTAIAYLTLLEEDQELAISQRTLASRRQSLELISIRQQGGQSALTDVRQAEVLVAEADAAMSLIRRQVGQLENLLSTLAGRAPGPIRRGQSFASAKILSPAPMGLPSELLNRRPDLRAAEQELIAATAEIGVAEAKLLPSFSLTAGAGLRSAAFADLFKDPARFWQLGPSVEVRVFAGGRLRAGLRGSQAARDEAEAKYRKAVLEALREVSDALIARQQSADFSAAQARVVAARSGALVLIREQYDNGVTSYLEVLYNDQQLFLAEISQARAQLDALTATVQLYRALGGGWDKSSIPVGRKP